jgi:carbamoyltransferase
MRKILGLSAFFHDAAAALVVDGDIVAAAQEERFSRRKNDDRFPSQSIACCLREGGLTEADLDAVVFYDKPILKFVRSVETWLTVAPRGARSFVQALPQWVGGRLNIEGTVREQLPRLRSTCPILFTTHHQAHAASAFYPSPFDQAAILTVDGVGEYATTTIARGNGNAIELLQELRFPHSLGLLYSAFTAYCGFHVNSGEYKLMGLAPYGEPTYVDRIRDQLLDLKADGSFRLNLDFFSFMEGQSMTHPRFYDLFGGRPRYPSEPIETRHLNVARSIQTVTEDILLRLARHAREVTGATHLCMAGGVALNCVANGLILREKIFDRLWIQPAAGDAGAALGAALAAWYQPPEGPSPARTLSVPDSMKGAGLGPSFTDSDIEPLLKEVGAVYRRLDDSSFIPTVAQLLADQKVVGWVQGRMEFGPRALGNRSILGDARSPRMQSVMNLKIKFRESFRPFAPLVLLERVADYFELTEPSPYMLLVAPVRPELRNPPSPGSTGLDRVRHPHSSLPAVTHVDYSARIQTVDPRTHPLLHQLLSEFNKVTGCGVLVNTSFNIRGEPIICTPADAFRCFLRTEMDALVVGHYLLLRADQPRQTVEGADRVRVEELEPARPSGVDGPKLREQPSEWRKFVAVWVAAGSLLLYFLHRRHPSTFSSWLYLQGALLAVLAVGMVRPRWFRLPYRAVTIATFHVGKPISQVVLRVFYWVLLTPFGWILRAFGHVPLPLHRDPAASTYWSTAPPLRGLRRPA